MTAKEKKLRGIADRLTAFQEEFSHIFKSKTRDSGEMARQYLSGLIQSPKANMERMEEKVPESNHQALQHFITESPWDEKAVLIKVAADADKLLGGKEDSCLLIDETSFVKKGTKSVGVGRQYCGRIGKTENCQVGVFAALSAGDRSQPIDFRLYLPKDWTDKPDRCAAAGIPKEEIKHRTKLELAIEIIKAAKEKGVRFNWVGADAGYGLSSGFLGDVQALGLKFVADVHRDQKIFLNDPATHKHQLADQWMKQQPDFAWRKITVRQSTKGKLVFEFLHANVWIKIGDDYGPARLIIRRNLGTKDDVKYTVTNDLEASVERLAYMQSQRFWIERAFEDAKSSLGMADYQVRKWSAWQHHMSLTLMAQLFTLKERIHNADTAGLLTVEDVVGLLAFYLPKRDVTEEEVFRQLAARHEKRQKDIDRRQLE